MEVGSVQAAEAGRAQSTQLWKTGGGCKNLGAGVFRPKNEIRPPRKVALHEYFG